MVVYANTNLANRTSVLIETHKLNITPDEHVRTPQLLLAKDGEVWFKLPKQERMNLAKLQQLLETHKH